MINVFYNISLSHKFPILLRSFRFNDTLFLCYQPSKTRWANILSYQPVAMIPFQTKSSKLAGNNYKTLIKGARQIFHKIEAKSKRKAYIRSAYFKKEKIFFDHFWAHLNQKSPKERVKRLKYFQVSIELVERSKNKPLASQNPHIKNEILYRFTGLTKEGELFYVQIKENKKTKNKYLMSCFPE